MYQMTITKTTAPDEVVNTLRGGGESEEHEYFQVLIPFRPGTMTREELGDEFKRAIDTFFYARTEFPDGVLKRDHQDRY